MKIINCEQGSDLWLQSRLGVCSASRFKDVLSKGRGGSPSKTRQSYLYQIAAEIITGQAQDLYTNDAMQWGTDNEPKARSMYEHLEGVEVEQVGFVLHNHRVGVSPDGLVGDKGLVEFKCPKTTTQIARVLEGVFPSEYKAQVQGQLWVCQREWTDFISFDPRITTDAGYFKIRVERDDVYIKELETKINEFLVDLDDVLEKVK